jgi:hypothetical protein
MTRGVPWRHLTLERRRGDRRLQALDGMRLHEQPRRELSWTLRPQSQPRDALCGAAPSDAVLWPWNGAADVARPALLRPGR